MGSLHRVGDGGLVSKGARMGRGCLKDREAIRLTESWEIRWGGGKLSDCKSPGGDKEALIA